MAWKWQQTRKRWIVCKKQRRMCTSPWWTSSQWRTSVHQEFHILIRMNTFSVEVLVPVSLEIHNWPAAMSQRQPWGKSAFAALVMSLVVDKILFSTLPCFRYLCFGLPPTRCATWMDQPHPSSIPGHGVLYFVLPLHVSNTPLSLVTTGYQQQRTLPSRLFIISTIQSRDCHFSTYHVPILAIDWASATTSPPLPDPLLQQYNRPFVAVWPLFSNYLWASISSQWRLFW